MEGWVKLHRKLIDWEWYQDSRMVHLFLHLLFSANFEDKKWMGVLIKRGQLATGLNALHLKTGISIQSLRTCLKHLEKTGEINKQTNNQFSIITISNYDSYQLTSEDTNKQPNKRTTSNQQATNKQLTTTKNVKKDKNEKEVYRSFAHLKLTEKEFESIKETGYTKARIDDILDSIENYKDNIKYTSLNLTVRKWLKREKDSVPQSRNINSERAPKDFGVSSKTALNYEEYQKSKEKS